MTPRPAALLTKSGGFIAQNAPNSVALYRVADGRLLHSFAVGGAITQIDVTADEELLLITCDDGSLSVWTIATGVRRWQHGRSQSGLSYIYDGAFAGNGKSLVACDSAGKVAVYDTSTGKRLSLTQAGPQYDMTLSAALSPGGSRGVVIGLTEQLFTFDVATGTAQDTSLKGAWPVRYSADGKYIAFRSSNSGSEERLRVVALGKGLKKEDVGELQHIGHIRPTADGGFLVTALAAAKGPDDRALPMESEMVGVRYSPKTTQLLELWRLPLDKKAGRRTDFDPATLLGVSTDFRLITRLIDLRTGKTRLVVDNSANYRPVLVSWTSRGKQEETGTGGIGASIGVLMIWACIALSLIGAVWVLVRRRAKAGSPPGPASPQ
jgi:hypothetical protein